MRIIISGSREISDYETVKEYCDEVISGLPNFDIEIVSGGARGVDQLAVRYAKEHGYKSRVFPAHWFVYGKAAGPARNREMAEYAASDQGVLIAFPMKGRYAGTHNMIDLAKKFGLATHVKEV